MPAASVPITAPARPRRRWVRRCLLGSGLLLLLLVAFHRPLLRAALRQVGQRQAAAQHLDLAWLVNGSITKDLLVRDVRVSGGPEHWLPQAKIGQLSARYDLWKLVGTARGDLLEAVQLHHADFELDLRKLPPSSPVEAAAIEAEGGSAPQDLVWPTTVDLQDVSADVTAADGSRWVVKNFTLQAGEGQPGIFRCAEISQQPAGWKCENLAAKVAIRDRRLVIESFEFGSGLVLEQFRADFAKLRLGELAFGLRASSGPAVALVEASAMALHSPDPQLQAAWSLQVPGGTALPGLPKALGWEELRGEGKASGALLDPQRLNANFSLFGRSIHWDSVTLDKVVLATHLNQGLATADLELQQPQNEVKLRASGKIPGDWASAAHTPWQASLAAQVARPNALAGQTLPATASMELLATSQGTGVTFNAAEATLTLADVTHPQLFLPQIEIKATATPDTVVLQEMNVPLGANNALKASGSLNLKGSQALAAQWKLACPELATALATTRQTQLGLAGALQLQGKVAGQLPMLSAEGWKKLTTESHLEISALTQGQTCLETAKLTVSQANEVVEISELKVQADSANYMLASGHLSWADQLPGEAKAEVHFPKLATLLPWAQAAGIAVPLTAGSLELQLAAGGTMADRKFRGQATLDAAELVFPNLPHPLALQAKLQADGKQLEVEAITLRAAQQILAVAQGTIPFASLSPHPTAEQWDVTMKSTALSLPLLSQEKVQGRADLDLKLLGNLAEPNVDLKLAVQDFRAANAPPSLAPAAADVAVTLAAGQLAMNAALRQTPLQPLRITAQAPCVVPQLLNGSATLGSTPFTANVTLPSSDLSTLAALVPAIATMQATAALDAKISGTVGRPQWAGVLTLQVPDLAFRSAALPGIKEGLIKVLFQDTTLRPDISAMLAGGAVKLNGNLALADPANPVFDLKLTAAEALILRDLTSSVRADADIAITGPLQALRFTGRAEAVRGRVFKEVEFLPLSLPESLPAPPPAVRKSEPMRLTGILENASFDLALRTKDPIRLMGNVLNGAVTADFKLHGTGAAPILTGKAQFNDAILSLPFSQMKLVTGEATIDPAKPMEPQINIRGESRVGAYEVTLYVFGSAFDPKTRFLSVPPLSEPDIAVLLATGAPLAASAEQAGAEAAGQAAFLLLRDTYRKMLKKKGPRYEEPPKLHLSFRSSSGQLGADGAAVLADYELTRKLRLSGSAAQSGNVRAMLSWLVRFGDPAAPAK